MTTFDWSTLHRSPHAWLPERTIFLTRHGSQAYGTARAGSDLDVKGVCVPPRAVLHGFVEKFEQHDQHEPIDLVIYDVRKFMALAAQANPTLIEVLWTEPSDWLVVTPVGRRLLDARELFLSRQVRQTFAGYALSQLKRIRTHRRWLLHPPAAPPTRAEFGLPERPTLSPDELGAVESQVRRQLEAWQIDLEPLSPASRLAIQDQLSRVLTELRIASEDDRFRLAARTIGVDDNLLMLVEKERAFRARMAEWRHFEAWQHERNPTRAALEAKFSYDTKHAMHLVRLLRMCREILAGEGVRVRRPDAAELLAIRDGAWSYDELIAWSERQERDIEAAAATSTLPPSPDRARLDALCVSMVEELLAAES